MEAIDNVPPPNTRPTKRTKRVKKNEKNEKETEKKIWSDGDGDL